MGNILDKIKSYLPGKNEQLTDKGGDYTMPIILAVDFIVLVFITLKAVKK